MYKKSPRLSTILFSTISVLLAASLACSLPEIALTRLQDTPATESADIQTPVQPSLSTSDPKSIPPGIILTQAAATIAADITAAAITMQAKYPPTFTTEPTESPSDLPQAPTVNPTNTSTATLTQTPQATATTPVSSPTTNPTTTATSTQAGYTPLPPIFGDTGVTPAFRVKNINLQFCNGGYTANLQIYGTSSAKLESMSLQFRDRNTSTNLNEPVITDLPFMTTDKTCHPGGIDALYFGQTRYIGGWVGPTSLSLHTIRATLKLCTLEGLGGVCNTAIVEFVIP